MNVIFEPLEDAARADVVLPRGAVLRVPFPGEREPQVDFMIVENAEAASGFALLVVTGSKAGIRGLNVPVEACVPHPRGPGIATAWLLREWTQWFDEAPPVGVAVAARGYAV